MDRTYHGASRGHTSGGPTKKMTPFQTVTAHLWTVCNTNELWHTGWKWLPCCTTVKELLCLVYPCLYFPSVKSFCEYIPLMPGDHPSFLKLHVPGWYINNELTEHLGLQFPGRQQHQGCMRTLALFAFENRCWGTLCSAGLRRDNSLTHFPPPFQTHDQG